MTCAVSSPRVDSMSGDRSQNFGKTHQVYMRFEKSAAWRVTFQDRADKHATFREFTFADSGKIGEIIARSATRMLLEDHNSFEYALHNGTGIVLLTLTEEQYRKLRP